MNMQKINLILQSFSKRILNDIQSSKENARVALC